MTAPRADTEALLRVWNGAMGTAAIERAGNAVAAALRERDAELEKARAELERTEAHYADMLSQAAVAYSHQLAPFLALAREARAIGSNDRSPRADGLRHNICDRLAALTVPPTEGQADG